jgi:large subunit ribosomal protein L17
VPSDRREAVVNGLVRNLVLHGQIRTTYARAKEAQRLADRLVTLGKDGSVHSRRRAFRVLQNRTLVKRLFAEIAPRYVDISGGYTRVVRLATRHGDGAQTALLALSRLPTVPAAPSKGTRPATEPSPAAPQPPEPKREAQEPKKGFFQSLRDRWARKKKGSAAA